MLLVCFADLTACGLCRPGRLARARRHAQVHIELNPLRRPSRRQKSDRRGQGGGGSAGAPKQRRSSRVRNMRNPSSQRQRPMVKPPPERGWHATQLFSEPLPQVCGPDLRTWDAVRTFGSTVLMFEDAIAVRSARVAAAAATQHAASAVFVVVCLIDCGDTDRGVTRYQELFCQDQRMEACFNSLLLLAAADNVRVPKHWRWYTLMCERFQTFSLMGCGLLLVRVLVLFAHRTEVASGSPIVAVCFAVSARVGGQTVGEVPRCVWLLFACRHVVGGGPNPCSFRRLHFSLVPHRPRHGAALVRQSVTLDELLSYSPADIGSWAEKHHTHLAAFGRQYDHPWLGWRCGVSHLAPGVVSASASLMFGVWWRHGTLPWRLFAQIRCAAHQSPQQGVGETTTRRRVVTLAAPGATEGMVRVSVS